MMILFLFQLYVIGTALTIMFMWAVYSKFGIGLSCKILNTVRGWLCKIRN